MRTFRHLGSAAAILRLPGSHKYGLRRPYHHYRARRWYFCRPGQVGEADSPQSEVSHAKQRARGDAPGLRLGGGG